MSEDRPNEQHGLTPLQKRFADAWAQARIAGVDFANYELAEAAGYTGTKEALAVTASRTLSHPKVREYLHAKAREYLREGAMDVAVTLRSLSKSAQSERVRADTAARLATGLGLIEAETGPSGPAVAIQLVFNTDAGAVLAQSAVMPQQPKVISGVAEVARSLDQGEGRPKAPARRRADPSPGGSKAAGGAGAGAKIRAPVSPPGHPRNSPPRKSGGVSGKISGSKKPRGGGGV